MALAAFGQQRYTIEPSGDDLLELLVYKTGLYRGKIHTFLFPKFQGSLTYDPQNPEASSVTLTLAAADIKLMDTWLSAKDFKDVQQYALKDMLDAARNPEIAFVSSQVRALDSARFEIGGALTIRGVTRPALVIVTMQPAHGGQLRFEGKTTVKMTDFKLKPPSAALGLVGTRDGMDFSFRLTARAQGS
jgi:polyisoprenoid-binding protein YceI